MLNSIMMHASSPTISSFSVRATPHISAPTKEIKKMIHKEMPQTKHASARNDSAHQVLPSLTMRVLEEDLASFWISPLTVWASLNQRTNVSCKNLKLNGRRSSNNYFWVLVKGPLSTSKALMPRTARIWVTLIMQAQVGWHPRMETKMSPEATSNHAFNQSNALKIQSQSKVREPSSLLQESLLHKNHIWPLKSSTLKGSMKTQVSS